MKDLLLILLFVFCMSHSVFVPHFLQYSLLLCLADFLSESFNSFFISFCAYSIAIEVTVGFIPALTSIIYKNSASLQLHPHPFQLLRSQITFLYTVCPKTLTNSSFKCISLLNNMEKGIWSYQSNLQY